VESPVVVVGRATVAVGAAGSKEELDEVEDDEEEDSEVELGPAGGDVTVEDDDDRVGAGGPGGSDEDLDFVQSIKQNNMYRTHGGGTPVPVQSQ